MSKDPNIEGDAIGKDMPGALKGDYDKEGSGVSPNYKGKCKNAVQGYIGDDAVKPSDFAQRKMQEGRAKAKNS